MVWAFFKPNESGFFQNSKWIKESAYKSENKYSQCFLKSTKMWFWSIKVLFILALLNNESPLYLLRIRHLRQDKACKREGNKRGRERSLEGNENWERELRRHERKEEMWRSFPFTSLVRIYYRGGPISPNFPKSPKTTDKI